MILDNQELISTRKDSKTKSIEITEKLELANHFWKEIDERRNSPLLILPFHLLLATLCLIHIFTQKLRDGNQDTAKLGAILFFVLASLSAINTTYEHSLAYVTDVFPQISLPQHS
jgi:hypothetical protein